MTSAGFRKLLERYAAALNGGDAAGAAGCFTADAVYLEPPDRQVHRGREELLPFFAASAPEPAVRMTWHHIAFDPRTQVGFGEYVPGT